MITERIDKQSLFF